MSQQDLSTQAQAHATARVLYLAVCTAWTWDAITSLSDEVEVFIGHPVAPIDVVYTLSRISVGLVFYAAFSFVILPSTFKLESHQCDTLLRSITWISTFSVLFTSLLFLVRANSVYHDSRAARVTFSLFWATKAISAFCIPFSYTAASVHPQNMCIITSIKEFMIIPTFAVGVFDTTVFVAISYRVTNALRQDSGWTQCKRFFGGSGACIGPISRSLLHTGQLYFFPSICLLICSLALQFSIISKSLELYQFQLLSYGTFLALTNSLACRVFRIVRLLGIQEMLHSSRGTSISTISFAVFTQEETCTQGSEQARGCAYTLAV